MTQLSKENIEAVADLKPGYKLGATDVAILQEMARRLLASEAQEPVAYIGKQMLEDLCEGGRSCGRVWLSNTDELSRESRIPLYVAPQQGK